MFTFTKKPSAAAVALYTGLYGLLVPVACSAPPVDAEGLDEIGTTQQALQSYTDGALFRENFESNSWSFSDLIRTQAYNTGGIDGRILRASYPPNSEGSPRISHKFSLNQQVTSATLSFDFKLHSQFDFVKGGKMHGLGGGNATTGCAPIDPDGWSVRMMWRANGEPELYVYHQDRASNCGDRYTATNFQFEKGRWYRAEIHVQMNSAPTAADGRARLYIDGQKLVDKSGLRLSGNPSVNIDKFLFSTFYGGSDASWAPSQTTYVYYDNFTVHDGVSISGTEGTQCEIFLEGIYNEGSHVCCDEACGACGGSGCSGLPGRKTKCCTSDILSGTRDCGTSSAPCKF